MYQPKASRHPRRAAGGGRLKRLGALGVAAAAVSVLAACTGQSTVPGAAYARHVTGGDSGASPMQVARTHTPSAVSVLPDMPPADLTARFASTLFASAPIVVVADATASASSLSAAARAARAAHAPLLLAGAASPTAAPATAAPTVATAKLAASVRALHPVAVLAVGLTPAELSAVAARLPGVQVVSQAQALPKTGTPVPLSGVAVLVPAASTAVITAVSATAQASGAAVIGMAGTDPRSDPAAIRELASQRPSAVVAVGARFGPATQLASRLAVAETGRQLPGGGQVLFPGRRLVALYGHPETPSLGVLGRQDLAGSLERAKSMAAAYKPLSSVPVVPAFEIIATVAEASPGPDGSYSYETPVSELLPWVRSATADGLYVVLDLQPGRASLLQQAEHYQSLLALPDVGLALDPEWKLGPGQRPLRQIGHVNVAQVNSVISWLAALTARYHLPQKLLVLHQFQLSMIEGEQHLDTSQDDLAIVIHMDGQGTPSMKQETWNAVTAAAPHGVFFGWKDFLVMDHPMLTPAQTMTKAPAPVMISYQ